MSDNKLSEKHGVLLSIPVSQEQKDALREHAAGLQRSMAQQIRSWLDELLAGRSVESLRDEVHRLNNELMIARGMK